MSVCVVEFTLWYIGLSVEEYSMTLETDEVKVIGTTSGRADSVCRCVWQSLHCGTWYMGLR